METFISIILIIAVLVAFWCIGNLSLKVWRIQMTLEEYIRMYREYLFEQENVKKEEK